MSKKVEMQRMNPEDRTKNNKGAFVEGKREVEEGKEQSSEKREVVSLLHVSKETWLEIRFFKRPSVVSGQHCFLT